MTSILGKVEMAKVTYSGMEEVIVILHELAKSERKLGSLASLFQLDRTQ
jgi:hypothetical protein